LIEATGHEHLGLTAASLPRAPTPHSYNDAGRVRVPSTDDAGHFAPDDGNAMGTYTERYVYDAVGNFITMQHIGSNLANQGWMRRYDYNETSLIEPGIQSNRLSRTAVGTTPETYSIAGDGSDSHGNMLRMPQLQQMQWDYKDQLQMTCRQNVNDEDAGGAMHHGERTWYVYDAAGQRVRKVTDRANNGGPKDERIYLGGFEIYRNHSGTQRGLARETLHIMDDRQRIALVETRNEVDDGTANRLIRYLSSNHLGSAIPGLDDQAQIVSYEEYTPYGSTSYRAVRNKTETPKRYCFTGKGRDEESGLCYHRARDNAPWLGRWTSCDPLGVGAGPNLYAYVNGRPIIRLDPDGLIDKSAQLWLYEQTQFSIAPVARAENRGITPQQHAALRGLGYAYGPRDIKLNYTHPDDKPFVTQPGGTRVTLRPGSAKENVEKEPEAGEVRSRAVQAGKFAHVYIDGRSRDLTVPPGTRFPPPEPGVKPFADYAKAVEKRAAAATKPADTGAAKSSPAVPAAVAASGEQLELNLQQRPGARPRVPAAVPAVPATSWPPAAGPGVVVRSRASASAAAQAVKGNPGAIAKGVAAAARGALVRTFVPGAAETLDSVAMVGVKRRGVNGSPTAGRWSGGGRHLCGFQNKTALSPVLAARGRGRKLLRSGRRLGAADGQQGCSRNWRHCYRRRNPAAGLARDKSGLWAIQQITRCLP
jgi:RHS repeat-associated protein